MSAESVYSILGKKVSYFRQLKNLTQESLANSVELNRTSISNIEQGRQKILLHSLFEIANALDIDPCQLLPQKNELDNLISTTTEDRFSIPRNIPYDERMWITKLIKDSQDER